MIEMETEMETKDEKKDFFRTLFGKRQTNDCGCGCCGNFTIEEEPETTAEDKTNDQKVTEDN